MGNNYDFRFNEPPLDRDRIEQHKDFAALMQQYQAEQAPGKRPGARLIWFGLATAVAAAIALLLILRPVRSELRPDELLAAQDAYFAEKALIQPPIPPAEPDFVQQSVRAESGGSYDLNEGLRLVVPERAFMDDRGRQINGEVELAYREMHDPVDFFLSGVPMHFDSAGQRYQMESAGMIELYGYQDGVPVQLAPGKTIQVELISQVKFTGADLNLDFDLFYLDTIQGGWRRSSLPLMQNVQYVEANNQAAPGSADQNQQLSLLAQAEAEAIAKAERQLPMPVKPKNQYIKPTSKPSFELDPANLDGLDTNTRNILEDKNLSGAWWIAEGQNYDERVLQVGWPEMRLRYLEENLYEMLLIAGDSTVQLQIRPVLIGSEQEAAQRQYEQDLEAYQVELANWDKQLMQRKQSLQDSFALERERLIGKNVPAASATREGNIVNRFEVDAFGVWNCDRLLQPGTPKLIEQLKDQTGKVYEGQTAYLIDGRKNTVYRFYAGNKTLLEIPASEAILIWVVGENGRMALLPKRMDQKTLTDTNLETLNLKLEDKQIREAADLYRFLAGSR